MLKTLQGTVTKKTICSGVKTIRSTGRILPLLIPSLFSTESLGAGVKYCVSGFSALIYSEQDGKQTVHKRERQYLPQMVCDGATSYRFSFPNWGYWGTERIETLSYQGGFHWYNGGYAKWGLHGPTNSTITLTNTGSQGVGRSNAVLTQPDQVAYDVTHFANKEWISSSMSFSAAPFVTTDNTYESYEERESCGILDVNYRYYNSQGWAEQRQRTTGCIIYRRTPDTLKINLTDDTLSCTTTTGECLTSKTVLTMVGVSMGPVTLTFNITEPQEHSNTSISLNDGQKTTTLTNGESMGVVLGPTGEKRYDTTVTIKGLTPGVGRGVINIIATLL